MVALNRPQRISDDRVKLVLLPGMDGTGTLYEPLRAALAPSVDFHIVRYPTDQVQGYSELERLVPA